MPKNDKTRPDSQPNGPTDPIPGESQPDAPENDKA